ncbi:glycosyltransferase [Gammaproteobacteria bacterium]|nr:glycosyltransferase [Gammaproteobacteria bacterium]
MDVAVITSRISARHIALSPWNYYREQLSKEGIRIKLFEDNLDGFYERHDVIMLHLSFNWFHDVNFPSDVVMPIFNHLSAYRHEHPECIHIVLHHWDMIDVPFSVPLWRDGDPILMRTPFYDRSAHYPFPPGDIWSYEKTWGKNRFSHGVTAQFGCGFIGRRSFKQPGNLLVDGHLSPNPHANWRDRVAKETSKVGIGICSDEKTCSQKEHDEIMSKCRMIVCPRGWGPQSQRHWDAWYSGKPVLTDRFCDCVEMVPGMKLKDGEHYLVFDTPEDIPDIVADWTRPSRADELKQIAENGRSAALSYDGIGRILEFFRRIRIQSKT